MDDKEVYEWGERPDDHNFIAPMIVAQDGRLSLRAKGLMFYLLALPKGSPMDSLTIAAAVKEGRDAVRVVLTELETAGYIVRSRRSVGKGKWVALIRLYPFGLKRQAPEFSGPVGSGPENPALVSQPPEYSGPENPAPSLTERDLESGAAATTSETNHVGASNLDPSRPQGQDEGTAQRAVTTSSQIPWTLTHLLEEWFNVRTTEQQQAWSQAWRTAMATNGEGDYDVETDLSAYLTRCREERREAKPSRWLRFLIEDRTKYRKTLAHHDDVLEQRQTADGGEQWALRSLNQTPRWTIPQEGTPQ